MKKLNPGHSTGDSPKKDESSRRKVGAFGEQVAADYLRRAGYRIRERNRRTPIGEIDIIAEHRNTLVFVEVRTRRGSGFGTAQESVDGRKQHKLRQLAESYVQAHSERDIQYRIDVVVVQVKADGQVERVELIKNAVEGVLDGY